MHETLDSWLKLVSIVAPMVFTVLSLAAAVGSFLSARRATFRARAALNENFAKAKQHTSEIEQLKREVLQYPDDTKRAELLERLGKSEAAVAEFQAKLDRYDSRLARNERLVFVKSPDSRTSKASAGSVLSFFLEALVNKELPVQNSLPTRAGEATK